MLFFRDGNSDGPLSSVYFGPYAALAFGKV